MLRTSFAAIAIASLSAFSVAAGAPTADADGAFVSEDGLKLVPLAEGLEFPWGLAELPGGDLLVTEREGRLRLIGSNGLVEAPVAGLPDDILVDRQGGLLGILLDPDFANNHTLYLSYSKDMGETNTTAVISAVLSDDGLSLSDVREIFTAEPRRTGFHFGCRMAFLPDGSMIVTLGDAFRNMDDSQTLDNLHGKIARIMPDGSIPADNPYVGTEHEDAIYSYGHRNVQGLVYDAARGLLIAHEHGPKGGDELNMIEPGLNYGWPAISYGINYDGTILTEETEAEGMEQPAVKWVPSIAPSGMALVETPDFADWQGDLLIGAMNGPAGQKLVRVDLDESGAVIGTVDLLDDLHIAYRDVISTESGIYVATADLDGAVYRVEIAE
ncbi:MAG: PQQ-dependent sugar dehydrogenase [Pseudomonadota bacterium]